MLLALVPTASLSANLLYNEDFESTGWESAFRDEPVWGESIVRTTNHPHGGSYCIRGNLYPRIDPITGMLGMVSPQFECSFNDISSTTPNEVFVRYYMRFDDSNWINVSSIDGSVIGTEFFGKFAYLVTDGGGPVLGFFWCAWGGEQEENDQMHLEVNGGYYTDPWVLENWGTYTLYDMASGTIAVDGQWNKIELYINYDNDFIMMWGNGTLSTHWRFPDGQVPIHSLSHLRGLQFWHTNVVAIDGSTDGPAGEYYCAWQIDDISVWDGIPDGDDIAPAMPTGLTGAAGLNQAAIDWDDNTTDLDLLGYYVYKSIVSGGPYSPAHTSYLDVSEFSETGLTALVPVYYIVRAVDTNYNMSTPTAQVKVTPTGAPPVTTITSPDELQVVE